MFKIDPSEIEHLDGLQLVQLLRVLLYAEARKAGVALRNVDVPLQITVADGGQDATIRWQDGEPKTDYLPGRDVVFQCKATDNGDSQWSSEVWTKASQPGKIKTKILNEAVAGALDRGASYIGITATPLVGTKPADRVGAIKKGICEAGGDPSKLAAVEVYDGNKLAAWASDHPAVALWIKEQKAQIPLAGFSTLDRWSKRADIAVPPFVASNGRGFSLGSSADDVLDLDQLAGRLVDHLDDPGACARIWGAAGIGKTRALHHALSTSTGALHGLTDANFIFCDFRDVPTKIRDVANQIKNDEAAAVLVVDNCPLDDARQLNDLARAEGSQLRVITVGPDGRDQMADCLAIRPQAADLPTIKGILKDGLVSAKKHEIDYIAHLCDGFPRIAVLVTRSYRGRHAVLKSADDVAEQIIQAAKLDRETVRALECLSLFEQLAPDQDPQKFDRLAELLSHMPGGLMFEHLMIASEQHLVGRNAGSMIAQPRPIADYLALRRLSYLRASTVVDFLLAAPAAQRDAMLARWRYLARSATLVEVTRSLRNRFSTANLLLAQDAEPYLAPFVHIDADGTQSALFYTIMQTSLNDLEKTPVSDGLLNALRLIASRVASFKAAALMVLRLAAASDPARSPPIVDLLRQLFQVALAGTEADDKRRRQTLTDALDEEDLRFKRACVEALGAMLRTYLTRSIDFEQVGAESFREEWTPTDQDTVYGYFKWALDRLLEVWRKVPELRPAIQNLVAEDLRNLLAPELLPTIKSFVDEVVRAEGYWFEATKGVGDWLFFDRADPSTAFAKAVRVLYDATLPAKPVEQALLYSRFWASDLHDPDKRYAETSDNPDFEYSTRRAQALAPAIAQDQEQLSRVITAMSHEEMNAPYAFAEALAAHLKDPLDTFKQAVTALDDSGQSAGIGFVRALLAALDRRLKDDGEQVKTLVEIAEASAVLSASPMNIHTALRVTDERLGRVTEQVREGKIDPVEVAPISYGSGLEGVSVGALSGLIRALVERTEEGGPWAALEILSMYTYGLDAVTTDVTELVKLAILSPLIAQSTDRKPTSADYTHDRMIRLLAASNAIDDAFARDFALQIERACRSVGGHYGRPSKALRPALAVIVKHAPQEVWAVLAGFYEVATRVERERLSTITSATTLFAYDVSRTGPGALYTSPPKIMLEWLRHDPEGRIGFLVSFFPILEQRENGWTWHPDLRQLVKCYGGSKRFKRALHSRIFPSSWGGSLDAHLTSFKVPLAEWIDDPNLGEWASNTLETVNQALGDKFFRA